VQARDADHVRLDLSQLVGGQASYSRDAVRQCPLLDRAEPARLDVVQGDEHLADLVVGDGVLGAELP
jgi:hypothetical protein